MRPNRASAMGAGLLFASTGCALAVNATMAVELLAVAAQRELAQLDEKLYLDVFARPRPAAPAKTRRLPAEASR